MYYLRTYEQDRFRSVFSSYATYTFIFISQMFPPRSASIFSSMGGSSKSGRKVMSFLLAIKALRYAQIRYTLHYVAASASYLIGHKKEPRLVGSKSREETSKRDITYDTGFLLFEQLRNPRRRRYLNV